MLTVQLSGQVRQSGDCAPGISRDWLAWAVEFLSSRRPSQDICNGGIEPRGLVEPDAIAEQPGPLQLEAYQQLVRQPC